MQGQKRTSTAAYVESGVNAHISNGVVAWTFDLDAWGVCGQGSDETSALEALARELEAVRGKPVALEVVDRIHGDEQAFRRDFRPASEEEREATLRILDTVRAETLDLVTSCCDAVLDWDDPERELPSWAHWRTLRGMAWHIADTDCRYYLPALGLPSRSPAIDLPEELRRSWEHVRDVIRTMDTDRVRLASGEVWTATKLLRRLAWHGRGELRVMRELRRRALQSLTTP